ncbi:flagellar assembly protein FliW [Paenibacillus sp. NPDC093718]|uniref:flagellar assembly protein FliW n=1 Tax=Paenibacillus sp. NPDC093718 TaxID=3390601 RepID=UPI003D0151D9
MVVNTKRFGPIEIEEDQVITFVGPVLGFGDIAKYIIIQPEENPHPFEFLQSVEDENLTFIVADPFVFFNDYEFQLDSHWLETLNIESEKDIRILVIVTVRSAQDITCNLKAPLVISRAGNVAAQIVLDQGGYSTRQPLMGTKRGDGADADPIKK